MSNFPPGKWSPLLVGDYWPDDGDLEILDQSINNRRGLKANFSHFSAELRAAQNTQLNAQNGHTAENIRAAFATGEKHAHRIADRNAAKESAYVSASNSVTNLRQELESIAAEGNQEIAQVEQSGVLASAKEARIIELVHRYRMSASLAAAKTAGVIIEAIQQVLEIQDISLSARQFTQNHGIDSTQLNQIRSDQSVAEDVRNCLATPPGTQAGIGNDSLRTHQGDLPKPTLNSAIESAPGTLANIGNGAYLKTNTVPTSASFAGSSTAPGLQGHIVSSNLKMPAQISSTASSIGPAPGARTPVMPSPLPSSLVSPPATTAPNPSVPPSANPTAAVSSPPHTPPISPTELAQSFNKGMESGAPFSAAAHAAPPIPITSSEPQISHAAQTITPAPANAQVHVPVVDSPPPAHHAPTLDTAQPTPIVAAAQPISAPVTPQAVGPLPNYGSDLRPPVTTTITPPSPQSAPLPPSAAPSSAPVTPSAGHSAANQPAVVRQTASSTPPPPPPQGTQAVAATATGAAIGTASADATARKRLQRLVTAVARQQSRIAWAAGDRADNTTLLVTDLASGWIPPGIDLPSAVILLTPARRRGNLEALLGDATITASYTPSHHVSDAGEAIPTSPRPRTVPDVNDLGWELSQATQWRDGLPRLAHTLAKAASAGTGVLDSEIALLHEHLAAASERVLDSYPHGVDPHDVGNWQLLAAIDALAAADRATANYHLAWFLAANAPSTH